MARKTILAVDDDPVVLQAVNMTFSRNYNIIVTRNGAEALELAAHHHPDLILLDIMMPDFDGISTLLLLKDDPETKGIPVVMLTAVGKKEKVIAAFKDGASGYVLKPFKAENLRAKVETVLIQVERQRKENEEEQPE
jgi:DNA-binding response OmpR family regulator